MTASPGFPIFFSSQQCSQNDCVSSLHRRIQRVLLRCELCLFLVTCVRGRSLPVAVVTGVMTERCGCGAQAGGLEVSFLLLTRVEELQ